MTDFPTSFYIIVGNDTHPLGGKGSIGFLINEMHERRIPVTKEQAIDEISQHDDGIIKTLHVDTAAGTVTDATEELMWGFIEAWPEHAGPVPDWAWHLVNRDPEAVNAEIAEDDRAELRHREEIARGVYSR